jgi:hypothetical protein
MKAVRLSVVTTASRAAAQSGLQDLLSYITCFVWVSAVLNVLGAWEPVIASPIGQSASAAAETLSNITVGLPLTPAHALIFHVTCSVFLRLPSMVQGSVWVIAALVGLWHNLTFLSNLAVTDEHTVGPAVIMRLAICALLLVAVLLAGMSTIFSKRRPPKSMAHAITELLGVPAFAWRSQRGRISNLIEWCGGGLLHGALVGAVIVALSRWSMVPAFGLDSPSIPAGSQSGPLAIFAVVVFLLGGSLKVAARSGLAANLQDFSYKISRPDILFLRPFHTDKRGIAMKTSSFSQAIFPRRHWLTTLEEVLLASAPLGAVISAIGQPEAQVAALGASRSFSANKSWQQLVLSGLHESKRVALVVDATPGIAWELAQVSEVGVRRKTMLLFQPNFDLIDALAHVQNVFGVDCVEKLGRKEKPLAALMCREEVRVVVGRDCNEFEYAAAMEEFLSEFG